MKRIFFRSCNNAPNLREHFGFATFLAIEGARVDFRTPRGDDAACFGCEVIEDIADENKEEDE